MKNWPAKIVKGVHMNAQSTLNHTPQAITPLPHSTQNVSFSWSTQNVSTLNSKWPPPVQWSQTYSGSFQGLGGAVASRQLRAGHQIQPADPWICTQNNKSHFQLAYILTGLSHREFGVAKEELDILIKSLFWARKWIQRGQITQGQYPGGASLLLGPLLLSNHDDILEVGQKWPRGWPGLMRSTKRTILLTLVLSTFWSTGDMTSK